MFVFLQEGELECADCLGKFKTKPILVKHRMRTHDREINPACPECKQIFPDTAALAQHMYSHTGNQLETRSLLTICYLYRFSTRV